MTCPYEKKKPFLQLQMTVFLSDAIIKETGKKIERKPQSLHV